MYVFGPSSIADQFTIRYVVPHWPADLKSATPFTAFLPGIMETHAAFARIAHLPRSVLELVSTRDELVSHRAMGSGYQATPLHVDVLGALLEHPSFPFLVVWSETPALAAEAAPIIARREAPVLHVAPDDTLGHCSHDGLTRERYWEYAVTVLAYWEASGTQRELAALLRESVDEGRFVPSIATETQVGHHHLLTAPNEATLSACGVEITDEKPLVGIDNEPYWAALREGVDTIRDLRKSALRDLPDHLAPFNLILTAPAVMKHWKSLRQRFTELSPVDRMLLRFIIGQIRSRDTFPTVTTGETVQRLLATPVAQAVLQLHAEELATYTSALAIRASGQAVPTIRIPTSVNETREDLERLAGTARGTGAHRTQKLSRLARRISTDLASGLPAWVFDELRKSHSIKLVADAPLEWLMVDGLPLMMRSYVSRIPVTPGNLSFGLCASAPELVIAASSFNEVLVVKAVSESDPVSRMLDAALDTLGPRGDVAIPDLTVASVGGLADLGKVLADYEGAALIWYGHGVHNGSDDVGSLLIGDEPIDPWTLRDSITLPPIVLLGACDAHPYAASHATTVNGLLTAGAVTVLGAGIPVSAPNVATWICRFLIRVGGFLPILLDRPHGSMRWSEFLPGLQRRQFVTEALRAVERYGGVRLSDKRRIEVAFETGMAIDQQEEFWFDQFIQVLSGAAEKDEDTLRKKLLEHAFFTEALSYTQFGNPENIVVAGDTVPRLLQGN